MRTLSALTLLCLAAGTVFTSAAPAVGAPVPASRPLQVDDLFKVRRVADPTVNAKGDLTYQVGTVDIAANKVSTKVWLRRAGEAEARELDLGLGSQSRPRLSPDGKRLAYLSSGQLWVLELETGAKRQITSLSGGASGHVWSPDGTRLAFLSTTVPSGSEAENITYLRTLKEVKTTGRHFKTLMYRHFDAYRDPNQVCHLFVVEATGKGTPRDLTAGWAHDVPDFGGTAAGDGFAWSPDGKVLAFGSHEEAARAVSTNGEIYEVSSEGGALRKISRNPAMDNTPRYSPDGKFLAWRAQRRPGAEADKWELWIQDRASGKVVHTTEAQDLAVDAFQWTAGGEVIFSAEAQAQKPLWQWRPGAAPRRIGERLHVGDFALLPGAEKAVVLATSVSLPPDLFEVDLGKGEMKRLSTHNAILAQELALNPAMDLWVEGAPSADGRRPKVHTLVVKPASFDPTKKYPVALVIHGGPESANADQWHPRWNLQAWAGRGFLVVAPNPRGSTGFGQAFTDEIQGDWGGRPIQDMLHSLDGALKAYPSADPGRVVACGGSYGGYAVNWLAGHHPERFAAFVSHAGIYNALSMQVATEELWFPCFEFKGFPWESPENKALWEQHSPHNGAAGFRKPMFVSHGEMDYRVVYTEGLQLFNVHQLKGIPSELMVFPDENHFILKPANSRQWYGAMLEWCERWTK